MSRYRRNTLSLTQISHYHHLLVNGTGIKKQFLTSAQVQWKGISLISAERHTTHFKKDYKAKT
jgi:hypothetical protein